MQFKACQHKSTTFLKTMFCRNRGVCIFPSAKDQDLHPWSQTPSKGTGLQVWSWTTSQKLFFPHACSRFSWELPVHRRSLYELLQDFKSDQNSNVCQEHHPCFWFQLLSVIELCWYKAYTSKQVLPLPILIPGKISMPAEEHTYKMFGWHYEAGRLFGFL